MITDPFKVLGIRPDASDKELKKAYRDLSKKYHPDANPKDPKAAEEKFKEVQEAYRQITDAREHGTSPYGSAPHPSSYQEAAGYGRPSSGSSYGSGGAYQRQQSGQTGSGARWQYREYSDPRSAFNDFFTQWQNAQQSAQREEAKNISQEAERYRKMIQRAVDYINDNRFQDALWTLGGVPVQYRPAQWYFVSAIANQGAGNNITAVQHAKRAVDLDPSNVQYAQLLGRLQSRTNLYQSRGQNYSSPVSGTGWCISLCAMNLLCNLCGGTGFYI